MDGDKIAQLVYLVGVVALVAPAVVFGFRSGRPVLKYIAIWLAIAVVIAAGYSWYNG